MSRWAAEDAPIETASALAYLVAFILCVTRLRTARPRTRSLLFLRAFLCFVFFGEEISWFQRVLGYPTPDALRRLSSQGEVNLHNPSRSARSLARFQHP